MKEKNAMNIFRSGLNCAQTILAIYAEDLQLDSDLALSISCGFGAGMGRLQETCGAVTGSYMVLGLYNAKKHNDTKDRKDKTYSMIQAFNDKFISLHGTTNCKKLINCDLRTEEGHKYALDNNVFETVCEKCILDSISILKDLTAL